ncbi:DegV family EDD domain-containing protein [Mycoplasmopsis mucosicanis]|uniref:DegV family EDD domain-containing protein n=1 Tax=Mycoplasmopsis mucosicanis TaxID=458208 RepID=A0A507SJM6_9BACT|nr:DegV family protein [Mycoplasmopsis mucosicanis]TQC51431.1 DegV family EDD domain-containing protein [Mycoplasmopsis mucosicanis]
MKKLGIIVDSFACMSKQEANEQGFYYVPLVTEIDGKEYQDGLDINREDVLNMMAKTENIKTSLPFMSSFEEVFSLACSENDFVLYIPISSKLSSTFSAANNFVHDFKNLYIYDNGLVGDQIIELAKYAKKHFEKYQNIDRLLEDIHQIDKQCLTFILPQNIKYLVKGGRVSSLKKLLLGVLSKVKLMPYIKYDLNGTSNGGLGRGPKGVAKQVISKFIHFTGVKDTKELQQKYKIFTIYGIDDEFNKTAIETFKQQGITFVNARLNSSVIGIHTGPEAHAYYIIPNLDIKEI